METDRKLLVEKVLQTQKTLFLAVQAAGLSPWLELDLTMSQLKGLFLLATDGPMMVSQLGSALGIGKPAASILVDRLVQLGLVERTEDIADRRRTLVQLSPRGEELVRQLHQGRYERWSAWLNQLSDDDLNALIQGLSALAKVATADSLALSSLSNT